MLKETMGRQSATSGLWDKQTSFFNKYSHNENISYGGMEGA